MLSLKLMNFFLCFVYFASFGYVCTENLGGVEIPDQVLSELYSSYKEAQPIEEGTVSFRRVFSNNKKYEIHVMKLNEVNGNKRHNLLIKEDNSSNPLIYINNPVETKVSNAYLTFEEFKKELTARILRIREEFISTIRNGVKVTEITTPELLPSTENEKKMIKLFVNELVDKTPVQVSDKPISKKTEVKEKHQSIRNQLNASYPIKDPVYRSNNQSKNVTPADTEVNRRIIYISKTISATQANTKSSHYVQNDTIEQTSASEGTTISELEENIKLATITQEANKKSDIQHNFDINSTIIDENMLETPEVSIVTENPIEPNVTEASSPEDKSDTESTQAYEMSTTTAAPKSKRTKFSRPHVFQKE